MVTESSMSTNLHLRDCKRLISHSSLIPFFMLTILIVRMSSEVMKPAVLMESALLLGKALTALSLSITQRMWPPFQSGRWNTGTKPDLIFVSVGPDSRVTDRKILEKFLRSQHRLSLIVSPIALPVLSKPVKR